MLLVYQEFLALNEELPAFNPSERLRYAVHEIMVRMKDGETIRFEELSEILKSEFKIDISAEILKDIFDKWDKHQKPDYSVFKKEDNNWMIAFAYAGYLKRKCRDKQNFGKHRKKNTSTSTTYTGRRGYGYYVGGKWVPAADDWRNPYGMNWEGWD